MTASRKSAIASLAYKGFVPVPSSPSDSARRFSLPVRQSLLTSRRESNRSNASALSAKSSDGSSGVPGTASSDVSLPLVSLDAVAPDVPQSVEQQRQEHLVTVEPSKQPVRDSTDRVSRIFSATASGDRRQISWIRGKMIGMGSFAKVFYGVNLLTEEVMAVKQVEMIPVYKHKGAVDRAKHRKKMLDALRMEVLLLRELEHPHIVKYLGFDSEEGGEINLFLEYVDGGSVASMLSRFGKFAEPVVRHITSQILDGLEYLHQHSIIHRDIKGANILVNSNGVAKIADFGISKKNEYNMAYNTNSRMSLQGSIYWMAPEVIKEKGYSAKVDIWSLGCVTLEMFTGTHPWMKLSEFQTMYKLGKENAPPVPDDLSREAREFLELSFTIEPEKRPTAQSL
ncbi:kinase-like domain-containing protein, partial [Zopfochytrium polystomum]